MKEPTGRGNVSGVAHDNVKDILGRYTTVRKVVYSRDGFSRIRDQSRGRVSRAKTEVSGGDIVLVGSRESDTESLTELESEADECVNVGIHLLAPSLG